MERGTPVRSGLFLSGLLYEERRRRGTRKGRRALGTFKQAVLVLRWFLDDTRMRSLARDNKISLSTAYDYQDEGVAVLAARRPSLHGALLAAKAAGHTHVIVDGTLIYTDRIGIPGPTRGVDLWWSGKHHHHGANIQVVSAPDGWPLWTSGARPCPCRELRPCWWRGCGQYRLILGWAEQSGV